jgi:MoxR-like ATPase
VEFLARLIASEALLRQERTAQRRIRQARFPLIKTLTAKHRSTRISQAACGMCCSWVPTPSVLTEAEVTGSTSHSTGFPETGSRPSRSYPSQSSESEVLVGTPGSTKTQARRFDAMSTQTAGYHDEELGSTAQMAFTRVRQELQQCIIGQQILVDRLLIALLADGHLLVEGAPGLAKTTAIKELAKRIEGDFHRLQFTPDLLPGDLTGTEIYRPQTGEFHFQRGPIFHNLVLADEVNRAPAKVQSALLEAMGERQVTVGRSTYSLPQLFLVMATQNPIEQEGTYPLPEAQLDRFLMHVRIGYPSANSEKAILDLARHQALEAYGRGGEANARLTQEQVFGAQNEVLALHMAPQLEEYLIQLLLASRDPSAYGEDLARWVAYGASPRGTIALDRCARAHAWLQGREYVSPEDIHAVVFDTLRHRVLMSFEAEAEGIDAERFIAALLQRVPVA